MARRAKVRVVLIGCERKLSDALQKRLPANDYKVRAISGTRNAIASARNARPHIALLGLPRPGWDGAAPVEALRAADRDVSVIALTKRPSVAAAVDAMKAEAYDYLPKPFKVERVLEVIDKAARERGLVRDPEEQFNAILGERIRGARQGLSLTLREIANQSGVTVSLVSQIELGVSTPSLWTLRKLANAIEVKLSRLLDGL